MSAAPERRPGDPAGHTLILVIEDDPAIATLICEVLESHSYRCLTATNADEALRQLETVSPALITLDLGLPGISGRTLLQLIRAREATAATPVVIITAEPTIEAQLRGKSQAIIRKPFELDLIVATVERLLAG